MENGDEISSFVLDSHYKTADVMQNPINRCGENWNLHSRLWTMQMIQEPACNFASLLPWTHPRSIPKFQLKQGMHCSCRQKRWDAVLGIKNARSV